MRVDVNPLRLSVIPGQPSVITVQVTNPRAVISGHRLRVLGIDPEWASLDQDTLSLFPDDSGVAVVTVTFPEGIPAGTRHLSIEITELTPPGEVAVVDVELTVPAELGIVLTLDPVSVTGGTSATTGVVIENTGNATSEVDLTGTDEEGEVEFLFDPPAPVLGPGEQVLAKVELHAHRPWFGSPKARSFSVNAGPSRAPVMAFGAWVQRPRLSRGTLALLGLAAAITVFAVVLTASLSQVVNKSNADRDLAIAVAQAASSQSTVGTASISGTVTLLATGEGVQGVTVQLFPSSDTGTPLVSTATGTSGVYKFSNLPSGTYKVQFSGADFVQIWYPTALAADSATALTVKPGQELVGVDVRLGGLPAGVSGQVVGGDPTGAVVTVQLPASGQPGSVPSVVTTETLDSSGNFAFGGIPSPSVYQLVVTKTGFATATQLIDLQPGEHRTGVVITLHQGDGSIAGTVSTAAGPLGGASISASDGTNTNSTVSQTTAGQVGNFTLTNLQTPATFTLLVSANGFASQTLSVSLAAGQHLTGVGVILNTGVGSISGSVTAAANGAPAGGVTVTATNGQLTVTTVSLSLGAVGSYTLSGLAVPSTYSVTFSSPDLQSQTQAVDLGATGTAATAVVNAAMVSSAASLFGTVTQTGGTALGEIAISLTSGSTTFQSTSASVPTAGAFEIDGITPGTYTISFTRTGGLPTSSIVTLTAGQRLEDNPVLAPAASITGFAYLTPATKPTPLPGTEVRLYLASQYPTVLSESTLTGSDGSFTFPDVAAPQSYVLAFAYPQGSSAQVTYLVTTSESTVSYICGSTPSGPTASCNSTSAAMNDPVLVTS